MTRIGYGRVSTQKESQKFDRQEDQLIDAGCKRVFLERVSGTSKEKPELEKALNMMAPHDELCIVSLDRAGRSVSQILELVEMLKEREIGLLSLREGVLVDRDGGCSPQTTFLISVLSSVNQLEVELIRSRVKEGLAAARRRGKKLGRPRKDMSTAVRMWQSKDYTVSEICDAVGCSKSTLYNAIHRSGATRD